MKLSKRLTALFAAVLMTFTVFTSAVPTYAAFKSCTLSCNGYTGAGSLTSNSNKEAKAGTGSSKTLDYLYAYVVGTRLDKNGDNPRYIGNTADKDKAMNSGQATISIPKTSSDYFKKLASVHLIKQGTATDTKDLSISY